MSASISIRAATSDDLPELLAMHAASLRTLGVKFYEREVMEALIEFGTLDRVLIDDGTYFAVEQNGRIVASGGWSWRLPRYETHADGGRAVSSVSTATVRSIFVHPAAARQGIGSRMMQHIEAEILKAGYGAAQLKALLSGIPFYRRIGWRCGLPTVVSLRENTPLVVLDMAKQLDSALARAA